MFEEVVFENLLLKELRVFATGSFFAWIFDEEFGLRNGGGGEGVGFDDVAAGFVKAFMDVGDEVGFGEAEDIAVVEEVFFVVGKSGAAGVGFFETVAPDGCSHRAIEDHDALGEGVLEFGSGVGLHFAWGDFSGGGEILKEHIVKSGYVDAFCEVADLSKVKRALDLLDGMEQTIGADG